MVTFTFINGALFLGTVLALLKMRSLLNEME